VQVRERRSHGPPPNAHAPTSVASGLHSPSLPHADTSADHSPFSSHVRVAVPQRPHGSLRVSPGVHRQSDGAEHGPQRLPVHVVVPVPHAVEHSAVVPGFTFTSVSSQSDAAG